MLYYTHEFKTILSSFLEFSNLPQAHLSILLPRCQSNNLFVVLWDKLIRQKQGTSESPSKFVSHFESYFASEHS